eukprot:gene23020-29346_t
MLDYDLLICALPMGWLILTGAKSGFRPWEKLVLVLVFLLPLFSRKLAQLYHLPIAPLILLALLAVIMSRLFSNAAGKSSAIVRDFCAPSASHSQMRVVGAANSDSFCRQPPQGGHSFSFSATTATSTICFAPAMIMWAIAVAS